MNAGANAVDVFLDKEAATAVVTEYVSALDACDWTAYGALFNEEVVVDYGAIGSLAATISSRDWVDRCRTLEGFDATAHRLHNLAAVLEVDRATVTSIVDAAHFVTIDGRPLMADIIARYTHHLLRDDGWKVAGVKLDVVGYPAGRTMFDTAFAAARAIFAKGNTR